VPTRPHLVVVAVLLAGAAACSSGDDGTTSTTEPAGDGSVHVGYVASWVEQFGAGVATDCRLTLESNPPVCGGPVPIVGLDLREVATAEQDPFADAISEPDRWALHDTYLEVAFEPDGTVRFVGLEGNRIPAPPPPVTCPDPGDGPLPRDWFRPLRGDPNVLGSTGGDEVGIDVLYVTDDVVDELCALTDVPTTITARGDVLED
jgi:hypothetical protein